MPGKGIGALKRSAFESLRLTRRRDREEVYAPTYLSPANRPYFKSVEAIICTTASARLSHVRGHVREVVSEAVHLQGNNKPETDLALTGSRRGIRQAGRMIKAL